MTEWGNSEPASAGSRRAAPGATRLVLLALAVAALLAALSAFAASRLALGSEAARREVEERLSALTGLPVTARDGAAEFHLLPLSRLSLADVAIGGAGSQAVLKVERITADLSVWRALVGQTVIERLVLERPELLSSAAFVADASGKAPGLDTPDAAFAALSGGFGELMSRFGSLTSIEIRNGIFRMGPNSASLGVRDANVVLSWPAPGSAATMSGTYVWNGQPTEIAVTVAAPLAFLEGARSAVDLGLVSPPLRAGFVGEGAIGETAHLAGRLKIEVPSLGRAMRWLGRTGSAPPELGPLAVDADLAASGSLLTFSDARVTLDGSIGRGALDVDFSGGRKPSLGGTLAFETLDLGNLSGALAPLPVGPLDFGRPFALGFVDRLDMDLRVSAASGMLGRTPVEDVAATLKFKAGTMTLDIGDATLLGGQGQMRATLATRDPVPRIKGFVALKGVEAARLLPAVGLRGVALTGPADLSADLEAPVVDWAGVLERNRFDAVLSMRGGGTLSGLDPDLLHSGSPHPFTLGAGTPMPFRAAEARIVGAGTRVDLRALKVAADTGTLAAGGLLTTAASEVDLAGTFAPPGGAPGAESGAALTGPQPIGFTMRGTWPTPDIVRTSGTKPM